MIFILDDVKEIIGKSKIMTLHGYFTLEECSVTGKEKLELDFFHGDSISDPQWFFRCIEVKQPCIINLSDVPEELKEKYWEEIIDKVD